MNCRDSLVLSTGYPYEFHTTIADVTLDGFRPRRFSAISYNIDYSDKRPSKALEMA